MKRVQLFSDADSSLRHSVRRRAVKQTHKQNTKAKAPQMTSKPLSGTRLKTMSVDELIRDMHVCVLACVVYTWQGNC